MPVASLPPVPHTSRWFATATSVVGDSRATTTRTCMVTAIAWHSRTMCTSISSALRLHATQHYTTLLTKHKFVFQQKVTHY